ncbi:MAG: hypothetical protein Hyperionvirus10_20 [Hyperionvirus sp.]|uniref:Uncharacterized protein n=1 Tax=Hyperionvirus sp. TaxID=2487770 RepID=A0A3G5AAS0_9VIRU|nr:MAG: hypothetical protein Hyperionvirus10_20 [Hyperionvirus sp.]
MPVNKLQQSRAATARLPPIKIVQNPARKSSLLARAAKIEPIASSFRYFPKRRSHSENNNSDQKTNWAVPAYFLIGIPVSLYFVFDSVWYQIDNLSEFVFFTFFGILFSIVWPLLLAGKFFYAITGGDRSRTNDP